MTALRSRVCLSMATRTSSGRWSGALLHRSWSPYFLHMTGLEPCWSQRQCSVGAPMFAQSPRKGWDQPPRSRSPNHPCMEWYLMILNVTYTSWPVRVISGVNVWNYIFRLVWALMRRPTQGDRKNSYRSHLEQYFTHFYPQSMQQMSVAFDV